MNLIDIIAKDEWADPITEEQEAALITRAKGGDDKATMALIVQYLPLIKRSLNAAGGHDKEDAAQEVFITVLETIKTHDLAKSPRLAGRLSSSVSGAVKEAGRNEQSQFSIPTGTLKRYNTILRAAEGNKDKALTLCKGYRMKESTFLHIHNLINSVNVIEEVSHFPSSARDTDLITDSILCEYAFTHLEDEERDVVRSTYGFREVLVDDNPLWPEGHNGLSSNIVAASMNISTHKVKVLKSRALDKMRDALTEREVVAVAI